MLCQAQKLRAWPQYRAAASTAGSPEAGAEAPAGSACEASQFSAGSIKAKGVIGKRAQKTCGRTKHK